MTDGSSHLAGGLNWAVPWPDPARAQGRADHGQPPGTFVAASRTAFRDYAEQWMHCYRGRTSRGVRAPTLDGYRPSLEQYALPLPGSMALGDTHPRHIKAFAEHVASTGATQNTLRGYVGTVPIASLRRRRTG